MKTVTRRQITTLYMTTGGEKKFHKVIDGGIVWLWVGVGWVQEGPPTRHQKRHLHHVVDDVASSPADVIAHAGINGPADCFQETGT